VYSKLDLTELAFAEVLFDIVEVLDGGIAN